MDKLVKKTQSQLRRYHPWTIFAIFSCTLVIILTLCYSLFIQLIIQPLAYDAFRGRMGLVHSSSTDNDPSVKADYVIGAESTSNTADLLVNYASLPMRRPEAELIVSYLKSEDTYLEFGASTTTFSFPRLVNKAYVIEHQTQVCAEVNRLQKSEVGKGLAVNLLCVEPASKMNAWGIESTADDDGYSTLEEYVDAPHSINMFPDDRLFDKVLINGPGRVACALRILPYLKPDSLVFFHDFFREPRRNSMLFNYYDEIARVLGHQFENDATNKFPYGLVVMRPKKSHPPGGDISRAEVHSIYRNISSVHKQPDQGADHENLWKFVSRTDIGGIDTAAWRKELVRGFSQRRVVLDIIALLGAFATSKVVSVVFEVFFRDALERSNKRKAARFSAFSAV